MDITTSLFPIKILFFPDVCSETNLHNAEVFKGVIFCFSCAQRIFQGCASVRKTRQQVNSRLKRSDSRSRRYNYTWLLNYGSNSYYSPCKCSLFSVIDGYETVKVTFNKRFFFLFITSILFFYGTSCIINDVQYIVNYKIHSKCTSKVLK